MKSRVSHHSSQRLDPKANIPEENPCQSAFSLICPIEDFLSKGKLLGQPLNHCSWQKVSPEEGFSMLVHDGMDSVATY